MSTTAVTSFYFYQNLLAIHSFLKIPLLLQPFLQVFPAAIKGDFVVITTSLFI